MNDKKVFYGIKVNTSQELLVVATFCFCCFPPLDLNFQVIRADSRLPLRTSKYSI